MPHIHSCPNETCDLPPTVPAADSFFVIFPVAFLDSNPDVLLALPPEILPADTLPLFTPTDWVQLLPALEVGMVTIST